MRKLRICLYCLAIMSFLALQSTAKTDYNNLLIYISMDKEHFTSDEEVKLKIFVKNVSSDKIRFKIYDKDKDGSDYISFQPVVFDMKGREAEIIVPYRLENRSFDSVIKGVMERDITLDPMEVLIHAVDLKKLYNLKNNTQYRVKSFFFPDFSERVVISSNNELTFMITDTGKHMRSGVMRKDLYLEVPRNVTPSEIVVLHLTAEKEKNWDRFIKYIDLDKFINSYSNYVRLYQMADDEEKKEILEDFITFLSRNRDDYIIDYEIVKEEVEKNGNIAYVEVTVDRFGARRTNRYRYRYTLEKYGDLWLITNLEASIMKGIVK